MAENPYATVYGLTGVMGSGKTTVAYLLEKRGACVIYADQLAREILEPQYSGFLSLKKQLVSLFGGDIKEDKLFNGDLLNRPLLANLVFHDREKLEQLNAIMHPEVGRLFREKMKSENSASKVIVYDIPLLFETGLAEKVKKTVVVYAPFEVALERATGRLGITKEEAKSRMDFQISIEKKAKMADYVVNNSGSREELEEQMDALWKYLSNGNRT